MTAPHRSRRERVFARAVCTAALLAAARLANAQVTFDVLYTFPGVNPGSYLGMSALIQATDGNFYGTTETGGAADAGRIYRMTPGGIVTILHEFAGGADGANPRAALIQATDGNFYGTTSAGGAANLGTVFQMTPGGVVTILHAFEGGKTAGADPRASLIQAADGNFYGTTAAGGPTNGGTVFRITPGGVVSILRMFAGGSDGAIPVAGLVQATDGSFFGTTAAGLRGGTIFRMTADGTVTFKHVFSATPDVPAPGSLPPYPPGLTVMQARDGNLYGAIRARGPLDAGSVFTLTTAGTFTTLSFLPFPGSDAPLIQALDGNFYGVTAVGLASRIFQMTTGGTITALQDLPPSAAPTVTALIQAADGNFYGTTGTGAIFRLGVTPQAPTMTMQPSSQTVTAGRSASFDVGANGFPPAAYRWQVSADNGASWMNLTDAGRYGGTSTSTLVVAAATLPLNGHQFRAVVTNAAGSATSSAAVLTVRPRVDFDVDGDGRADFVPFNAFSFGNSAIWTILGNSGALLGNPGWGLLGDVPVPADYDGDGRMDLAVYRPSTGTWHILESSTSFTQSVMFQWGLPADAPVPGDYDGDGLTDLAVYRPSTGVWYILSSSTRYDTALSRTVLLGHGADIPVPADYDGDGKTDTAVFRPSTGLWFVQHSSSGARLAFQWGLGSDIPVPGDYDGDSVADLAVYRPSTGVWFIRQSTTGFTTSESFQWGFSRAVPAPIDWDGDGKLDLAVWANGWRVLLSTQHYSYAVQVLISNVQWGFSDSPTPNAPIAYAMSQPRRGASALASLARAGDLDGDGRSDLTVFRPSAGAWLSSSISATSTSVTSTSTVFTLGVGTDLPVTGDFDGDGKTDAAVYTPATGMWTIRRSGLGITTHQWGLSGDVPVPGDYDGDGTTDLAVYRPSNGVWYILQSSTNFTTFASFQWGLGGDVPVAGDYDRDGVTDLAVYRPSTGMWFLRQSTTSYTTSVAVQWGLSGDITVPGDYDGDTQTDFAVYRPSTGVWYIARSNSSRVTYQWGIGGDVVVPGDYDGDGKTDVAVWRPSTHVWHILKSSTNFKESAAFEWGQGGDVPIGRRE